MKLYRLLAVIGPGDTVSIHHEGDQIPDESGEDHDALYHGKVEDFNWEDDYNLLLLSRMEVKNITPVCSRDGAEIYIEVS